MAARWRDKSMELAPAKARRNKDFCCSEGAGTPIFFLSFFHNDIARASRRTDGASHRIILIHLF
jgi:hypothetical protein